MIRIALAKLRGYTSFSRFTMLFVVSVLFIAFVASHVTSIGGAGQSTPFSQLLTGATAWTTICALTRLATTVPAFFLVQLVSAELELRVTRAQVIAGLERRDVVGTWLVQSALFAALAVVTAIVTVLLFGGPEARALAALGKGAMALGGLFVYTVAYLSIAVLCATLLRRPVPSLALLLGTPLILEPLVTLGLDRYGFDKVDPYLPFATLTTLVPWPTQEALTLSSFTAAAVAYGVAAVVLTWARLMQTDL